MNVLEHVRKGNKELVLCCNDIFKFLNPKYTGDISQIPNCNWIFMGTYTKEENNNEKNYNYSQKLIEKISLSKIIFNNGTIQMIRQILSENESKQISSTLSYPATGLTSIYETSEFYLLSNGLKTPILLSKSFEFLGEINLDINNSYYTSTQNNSTFPIYDESRKVFYFIQIESYNKYNLIEWNSIIGTIKKYEIIMKQSDILCESNSYNFTSQIPSMSSNSLKKIFLTHHWLIIIQYSNNNYDPILILHIERNGTIFHLFFLFFLLYLFILCRSSFWF